MLPSVTCPSSRHLAAILVATLLPTALPAQSIPRGPSVATAHSIYGFPEPVYEPMPSVAPVFLQTDQIDSSITVVNSITVPANGTITLRDQQGMIVGRQVINFPAHSSTPVSMRSLLATAGSTAHSGSVTLDDDPALKGPALIAQLSMTLHSGSQPSFLEEEFGMPTMHGSTTLQGVASQTRNLPLIGITSVSNAPQTIHAACVGEDQTPSAIELPAFGTAVVQACSWHPVLDSSLNLSSSLLSSGASTDVDHAVSLTTDSVPGAFYAFGFALNGGLDQAQLQPLDFYDPGTLPSSSITYVGVPIGSSSLLPSTFSAPVVTLANFSNQPRQTTVTWSDSSSGTPRMQPVASVTLTPLSTQTITLSAVHGTGVLHSFTIASDGKPGSVQAHLFTHIGSSQQRMELLAKDTQDDHNGGNHPWSIANGDTSTLLLYNSSAQAQYFHLRISGSGNSWIESYKLAPAETRAFIINDIIHNSKPDQKKNALPLHLRQGEVQWNTDFGGTGRGRLLVTNPATSLARNFSCDVYANECGALFGPSNFENLANGVPVDLTGISVMFCRQTSPYACTQSGSLGTASQQAFTTMWINNSSSIVSEISETNTDLQLKGISPGKYSVTAYATAGSCQSSGMGGGGTVQFPTTVKIVGSTVPSYTCSNGNPGHQRNLWEQAVDQSLVTPMTNDGVSIGEIITAGTPDNFGWGSNTGTGGPATTMYTNAPGATPVHGVWQDQLFDCPPNYKQCLNGTGGSLKSVLIQQNTYNGNKFTQTNQLVETCSGFTVNSK